MVYHQSLVTQSTVSCGCWSRDRIAWLNRKHGLSNTPEYQSWKAMRTRTRAGNPYHHDRYGDRGITVAPEWSDFETFLRDMGPKPSPKHSLERIDNDGPYAPENCRWALPAEQQLNRRNTRYLTVNGVTRTLKEWAELHGLDYGTVRHRLRRGWDPERALSQPGWSRKAERGEG